MLLPRTTGLYGLISATESVFYIAQDDLLIPVGIDLITKFPNGRLSLLGLSDTATVFNL